MKAGTKIVLGCTAALLVASHALWTARRNAVAPAARVAITISALKKRYKWSEPTVCRVKIKNTGTIPVKDFFTSGGAWAPYAFLVRDARGQDVPTTPYHAEYVRQAEDGSWSGSGPFNPDLRPGQASMELLTISKHVVISGRSASEPASFSVQVKRLGALSNTIRISIGP